MYINIAGINRVDLLVYLAYYALGYLSQTDPERRVEYESRLEDLEVYEGPVSIVGFLPFVPVDQTVWVDLRGDLFDPSDYDRIFGPGAAVGVVDIIRGTRKRKRQYRTYDSPSCKRRRVEYALRAPGPSTSAEAGTSAEASPYTPSGQSLASFNSAMDNTGGPGGAQAGIDYSTAMPGPSTSTSAEAGSSTGTPPDKRYRVEYALRAPGTSTSAEAGTSAEASPYTQYGQPSASFDSAMDNAGGQGGAQAGIDYSMAMPGAGTSGAGSSAEPGGGQPSTSLEHTDPPWSAHGRRYWSP